MVRIANGNDTHFLFISILCVKATYLKASLKGLFILRMEFRKKRKKENIIGYGVNVLTSSMNVMSRMNNFQVGIEIVESWCECMKPWMREYEWCVAYAFIQSFNFSLFVKYT